LIKRGLPLAGERDCLSISRHDIEFFNVDPSRVAVEIRVMNVADQPSAAETVVLRAAPFGAFVPWQPLGILSLPALAPGQVVYLRTGARTIQPEPLGRADRVPPRELLIALGLADEPPRKPQPEKPAAQSTPASGAMPPDLMQLLVQETPHWVGNLNVLVGNTDVERHRALALRVYPGRLNMAWFVVGSRGRDAYAFRLSGCGNDWEAKLFDMTSREALVLDVTETPGIPPEQWIPSDGTRAMLLALRPPKECTAGNIEVRVCQQSTGRTAVVEFNLDPNAAGRGCYVV
jgi:hypothetical protein